LASGCVAGAEQGRQERYAVLLRELDLSELDLDLAPLARLERLEKLDLRAAHGNDLSPLRGLRRLRSLSLWWADIHTSRELDTCPKKQRCKKGATVTVRGL
jgi:hypothetical protein